jgi:hypothetical protein
MMDALEPSDSATWAHFRRARSNKNCRPRGKVPPSDCDPWAVSAKLKIRDTKEMCQVENSTDIPLDNAERGEERPSVAF